MFIFRPHPFRNQLLLIGISAVSLLLLFLLNPIPQPLEYHDFADKRIFFTIPNTFDVLSNGSFVTTGIFWLYWVHQRQTKINALFPKYCSWFYNIFFLSVILAGVGSCYYHLHPNHYRLLFDRIPIALTSMAFLSALLNERVLPGKALGLGIMLILLSIGSVVLWYYSEPLHQGDLRFYGWLQALPMLLAPLILWLYPSPYTGSQHLVYALILLIIARLAEISDKPLFDLTHHTISGHSLKHFFASATAWSVGNYLKYREKR